MRIAVTGGAGFIGHHVVARLLRSGHEVVVLDNLQRGSFARPGLEGAALVTGDIRDRETCAKVLVGAEAVIHLAAQANVVGSSTNPAYAFETNVNGTWNVGMAACHAGVKHLIFASSREVYGEPACLPVHESAQLHSKNLYGATKIAGETALSALPAVGPGVSVLRLANVIGHGDSGRVIPNWLEALEAERPLTLFGGEQELDFVPVETVVQAICVLLEQGPQLLPINIGSGTSFPIAEVAERILALRPGRSSVQRLPGREIEVLRFRADTGRMRKLLGIEPPPDPLEGLAGMLNREPQWA